AEDRALKLDLEIVPDIFAALRPVAAPPAASAEQIAEAEEVPQNVAEVGEGFRVESAACSLQARVSVPVERRALLGVAQNAVGFGALLELLLRIRVIGVAVRMILQRQLA